MHLNNTMSKEPIGRAYLERRSEITKLIAERANFKRIAIIDDTQFDADVLAGVLRRVLGRNITIEITRSLMTLHKSWATAMPDLVFLDDRLGAIGTAATHIPAVRRIGFQGPVVVVSGLMTRQRRAEIIQLGAADMLHKDDLDTLTVMELILKLIGVTPSSDGSAQPA